MVLENNFQYKISKKQAWLRGKVNNPKAIPEEIAEIVDVVFVKQSGNFKLAYQIVYENGHIAYVFIDEAEYFEIFAIDMVPIKATIT